MACLHVADEGDGLKGTESSHIANILNKRSRTTDKAWSSRLGVGRGADNQKPACYIQFLGYGAQ